MPSLETHRLFGNKVLQKIKLPNIDKNIYYIFNQSFDNYLYYKFFSLKKCEDTIYLNKKGHRLHTRDYLINIANIMKENNLNNDSQCRAYLFGSINHYVLDSTFHPYIFYKTGVFNPKLEETYKYNSLHTKMESMLDCYFYEKNTNKKFYKYKIYKLNFPKVKFNDNLLNLIDESIFKTFKIKNGGKLYYKGYKTGRFIFKHGVYDPIGIKKQIYKLIDIFRGKKRLKCKYVSDHIKKIDNNYLNLEHKNWYHPASKEKLSYSVDDLFDIALKKSVTYFKLFDDFLNNKIKKEELIKKVDNISYVNGLDNETRHKLQYFEF